MNYEFTNEDVKLVEKFIELKNHGYYCDGAQLTTAYNRILDKHVATTNCGSCIRQRINELEQALNHFKAQIAKTETEVKEEENKTVRKSRNRKK